MSYPFKAFPLSNSKPHKLTAKLALMCGLALLSAGTISAQGLVYGHAEVTIGGPNVQITLGKTWETGDRCYGCTERVVYNAHQNCGRTERVVYDDKDDYVLERREIVVDEPECRHNEYDKVVVYRDHPRCDRDVSVIRYDEPVRYERDVRIIRENVPTRCNRGTRVVEVVRDRYPTERVNVIRRTDNRVVVVNGPDRNIIVTHGDNGHREYGDNHGGNGRGQDNGGDKIKESHSDNGRHYGENYEHSDHTSRRDLNDRPSKRVSRERGQSGRTL